MAANPKDKLIPAPARGSALARPDLHRNALEDLLAQYQREKYNFATPITVLDQVPPMHRVSVRVVQIDPKTETYPIPGGDKVGLGKTALDKIAAAAGISWSPERCGQIDSYNDPHRCKYRAVCTVQDFDGRRRTVFAEKEVDLRGEPDWPVERLGVDTREFIRVADNKAPFHMDVPAGTRGAKCRDCGAEIFWVEMKNKRKMPLDPNGDSHFATCPAKVKLPAGWERVYQQRSNIHSLAESKAKLRCIRAALGVPVSMSEEQAAKPFVVPALVPDLDTTDPEIKRMMAASLLGATEAMYGPKLPAGPLPTPVQDEPEAEPIDVSAMPEEEPVDRAIAGQQSLPIDDPELGFPPEEPTTPPCVLPITPAALEAAGTQHRHDCLAAINKACAQATANMPPEVAAALFAKVSAGFDPLTASTQVMRGVFDAIRAEIARVLG